MKDKVTELEKKADFILRNHHCVEFQSKLVVVDSSYQSQEIELSKFDNVDGLDYKAIVFERTGIVNIELRQKIPSLNFKRFWTCVDAELNIVTYKNNGWEFYQNELRDYAIDPKSEIRVIAENQTIWLKIKEFDLISKFESWLVRDLKTENLVLKKWNEELREEIRNLRNP